MLKSATQIYVAIVSVVSIIALMYVYIAPPTSMFVDRDGVPHFTPGVEHPETGEPIDMGVLIKHFKGD